MPTADQIGTRGIGVVNPSDYGFSSFQDLAGYCTNTRHWIFNPACWDYSLNDWLSINQLSNPPAPPHVPAVSAGTSTIPAPYTDAEYQAAIDAAIAEAKAQAEAQNIAFFQTVPQLSTNGDGGPSGTSIPTWLIVAGVVVGVILISRG